MNRQIGLWRNSWAPVPHVRGDEPLALLAMCDWANLFPTCVGMNHLIFAISKFMGTVPHVRGDEPAWLGLAWRGVACSPRAWG